MAEFDRADTFAKVVDTISQKLSIDKNIISEDSTLQDLGADSLSTFEIILKFQDVFGMEIDDDAADNLSSVRDAVDYIQGKRTK